MENPGPIFKKATKTQAKLRAAVFGPSGAGKTFTSLLIAKGMIGATGGRIALIDSERGSASKYADRFDFDTLDLVNRDVSEYVEAIRAAAGYDVLIIDSMSHAWQELQEQVERIAKAKFGGNYWAAWSDGTPIQKEFIGTILDFPGHVICTMRSKTEWGTEDQGGKKVPKRVGLAPEQRQGLEYEFDFLMAMTVDHIGTIEKDRTSKFQDKIIDKPGEQLGAELVAWLSEGAAPTPRPTPAPRQQQPKAPETVPIPENGDFTDTVKAVTYEEKQKKDKSGTFKLAMIETSNHGTIEGWERDGKDAAKFAGTTQVIRFRVEKNAYGWKVNNMGLVHPESAPELALSGKGGEA